VFIDVAQPVSENPRKAREMHGVPNPLSMEGTEKTQLLDCRVGDQQWRHLRCLLLHDAALPSKYTREHDHLLPQTVHESSLRRASLHRGTVGIFQGMVVFDHK
tara:strand:- start:651 stop:959 length:309 start_codon:yes stop_codon:yes gene_type:complete